MFAARMAGMATREMALVLDDSAEVVAEPDHADAWREWLRLSDVLAMSQIPHRITTLAAHSAEPSAAMAGTSASAGTVGLPTGSAGTGPSTVARSTPPELPGGWADVDLAYADPLVVEVAHLLAESGVPPAEGGAELETGSTAELAWTNHKVAVVYAEMPAEEVDELRAAGWVVRPVIGAASDLVQTVIEALNAQGDYP